MPLDQHLILFSKRPRKGTVKTRLVPPLTAEDALALYEAFLEDQIGFLRSCARPDRTIELCMDGPWNPDNRVTALLADIARAEQGPGDLGARLRRAFSRSRRQGASLTVVIGADAPTLPREHVSEAFRRLAAGASAVVSPAEDGGYVLIGLSRTADALFEEVPWGGPAVLEVTRRRASEKAVRLEEIPPWYDVDDRRGLARLWRDLRTPEGRRRAPATARVVAGLPANGREDG